MYEKNEAKKTCAASRQSSSRVLQAHTFTDRLGKWSQKWIEASKLTAENQDKCAFCGINYYIGAWHIKVMWKRRPSWRHNVQSVHHRRIGRFRMVFQYYSCLLHFFRGCSLFGEAFALCTHLFHSIFDSLSFVFFFLSFGLNWDRFWQKINQHTNACSCVKICCAGIFTCLRPNHTHTLVSNYYERTAHECQFVFNNVLKYQFTGERAGEKRADSFFSVSVVAWKTTAQHSAFFLSLSFIVI